MSKLISLEDYLKQQKDFYEDHVKFHPANAFCGSAGPEEQKHIESLVDTLSDSELAQLAIQNGITTNKELDRSFYEGAIDEIDREDFYRTYEKLLATKNRL